jgi:hypothetical protein
MKEDHCLRAYVRALAHSVRRLENQTAALIETLAGADSMFRRAYEIRLEKLENDRRERDSATSDMSLLDEMKRIQGMFEREQKNSRL